MTRPRERQEGNPILDREHLVLEGAMHAGGGLEDGEELPRLVAAASDDDGELTTERTPADEAGAGEEG